jgi:5-methylcytosine-specific restriction endonuclease McrA
MGRLKAISPRIAPIAPRVTVPAKVADPFYQSAEWVDLCRAIKRQRGYICQGCGADCRSTPRRLIGDHIVERKDGGADLDPLNVQLLCIGCHNRKTARARERRQARPD